MDCIQDDDTFRQSSEAILANGFSAVSRKINLEEELVMRYKRICQLLESLFLCCVLLFWLYLSEKDNSTHSSPSTRALAEI